MFTCQVGNDTAELKCKTRTQCLVVKAILETIINLIANRRRDRYGRELTNGSRHSLASPSCRNLNLRFLMKTTMLVGARQAIFFAAVFEFCFRLASKSWVVQTKMSNFREMRARIAYAYGNRFINDREFVLLYNA